MTTDALPELMKSVAGSVRRAATVPDPSAVLPVDFAALVRYCRFAYREARRVRRAARGLLVRGVEGGDFQRRCIVYLESVAEAADAAALVHDLADRMPPSEETAVLLSTLAGVEKGLASVRADLVGYLETMDRLRSQAAAKGEEIEKVIAQRAEAPANYLTWEPSERRFRGPGGP